MENLCNGKLVSQYNNSLQYLFKCLTGGNQPTPQGFSCVLYFGLQNSAMLYWKEQGAPVEKLLMGFPTFGRPFLLTSTDGGLGAPTSSFAAPGPYTQEMGLWSHYEVI